MVIIFLGIFESERGASGLLGDFTFRFNCFTAVFLTPTRFLSLVRMGEPFTDLALFAASISEFFK